MRKLCFAILLFNCFPLGAQENNPLNQAGKFWMSWGYNRAWYPQSDIHIHGTDFDVVFYDVNAKDRPEAFSLKNYFSITRLSIPQNNYRFGYQVNQHWGFSMGLDHMKYVVRNDQEVNMSGVVLPADNRSNNYVGSYINTPVYLSSNLLKFEHTNGLNLLSADAEYTCRIAELFKNRLGIYWQTALGLGIVIPKTEAHIFADAEFPDGYGIDNKYHIAGYSASFRVGTEFRFLKNFFVRPQLRSGWMNLPDIYINNESPVRADQQLVFHQFQVTAGGFFHIRLRKKK
jgi:hypothetical protein